MAEAPSLQSLNSARPQQALPVKISNYPSFTLDEAVVMAAAVLEFTVQSLALWSRNREVSEHLRYIDRAIEVASILDYFRDEPVPPHINLRSQIILLYNGLSALGSIIYSSSSVPEEKAFGQLLWAFCGHMSSGKCKLMQSPLSTSIADFLHVARQGLNAIDSDVIIKYSKIMPPKIMCVDDFLNPYLQQSSAGGANGKV